MYLVFVPTKSCVTDESNLLHLFGKYVYSLSTVVLFLSCHVQDIYCSFWYLHTILRSSNGYTFVARIPALLLLLLVTAVTTTSFCIVVVLLD